MKRTSQLKRSKPLRRSAKKTGVGTTRKRSSRSDPAYLAEVRKLPCAAFYLGGSCDGPRHAHHPRHLAGGVGIKAPDATAIPLCPKHHGCLHAVNGPFKGWKRKQLREWQDWAITRTQSEIARDYPEFAALQIVARAYDIGHARGSADRQAEIVGWIDETAQEAFRLMRDDQARALVFLRDAIRTGAIESGRRQGDGEGGE